MALTCGFFNSLNGDREYNADQISAMLEGLISDGIFESVGNKFIVSPSSGLTISVGSGRAKIQDKWVKNDGAINLTLNAPHVTLNRWTAIVLRKSFANRDVTLEMIDGTNAAEPEKPEIVRNASTYDICLAYIYVHAGAVTITESSIEDTRLNSELCGFVVGLIEQFDTTQLYNQIQADLNEFETEEQAEFLIWFETIRDILDENVAGHLQNEINDIVNVYGAKNLLPYPYNVINATSRGVTFTTNIDGSVSFSGVPSESRTAYMSLFVGLPLKAGSYTFSGGSDIYGGICVYFCDDPACTIKYSGTYDGDVIETATALYSCTTQNSSYNPSSSNRFGYDKTVTVGSDCYMMFQVRAGDTDAYTTNQSGTIRPMFRIASISESTYVQYAPTNREAMSWKANGKIGAKNLLPYPYYDTTKTLNGVTFTDNGDGSITLSSAGAVTETTRFYLYGGEGTSTKTNIFKGMLATATYSKNIDHSKIYLYAQAYTSDYSAHDNIIDDEGKGIIITERDLVRVVIGVLAGADLTTPVTIYPMIRIAEDTDNTYVPYAMTNKQLTDNKQDKSDSSLTTTSKNVIGAINEHEGDINQLKSDFGLAVLTLNNISVASGSYINADYNLADMVSAGRIPLGVVGYRLESTYAQYLTEFENEINKTANVNEYKYAYSIHNNYSSTISFKLVAKILYVKNHSIERIDI